MNRNRKGDVHDWLARKGGQGAAMIRADRGESAIEVLEQVALSETELRTLRDGAWREGYALGKRDAHASGYAEGYAAGRPNVLASAFLLAVGVVSGALTREVAHFVAGWLR